MKKMICSLFAVLTASAAVHAAENLLANPTFADQSKGWTIYANDKFKQAGFVSDSRDGRFIATLPAVPNAVNWWGQLKQQVKLVPGKTYLLSLKVKAEQPGQLGVTFQNDYAPYANLGLSARPPLKAGEETYRFEFKVKDGVPLTSPTLMLFLGQAVGRIEIAEPSLTEKP